MAFSVTRKDIHCHKPWKTRMQGGSDSSMDPDPSNPIPALLNMIPDPDQTK